MAGLRRTIEIKREALRLIRKGNTYAQIQYDLGIPKSTLSVWANQNGKKPNKARQLAHLKTARIAATKAILLNKNLRIAQALKTATTLAESAPLDRVDVRKSLLAMLYWAEGGKQDGNMKFTNTDPDLLFLFLSLLRSCYPLTEERLHIALQLHYYHHANEEIDFWSKKLGIPSTQFWKIYRKPRGGRGKYRRNSHGICNLHYSSSAIQRELLSLGRELMVRIGHEKSVRTLRINATFPTLLP